MNFRGNSEDHQFVEKVLGIYRGELPQNISMDFPMSNPQKFRRNVSRNFHRKFSRNGVLGKFREISPSVYSKEGVPRYIPRKESLGIFRGMSPSVYSEEMFVGNFRRFISWELKKKKTTGLARSGTPRSGTSSASSASFAGSASSVPHSPPVEPPSGSPTKICDHPCPSTEP
ncbi:hypothetical protein F2Q68_00007879 [Brassica cretica]|uniref:Uncharacterized protein n=1 Tax=Brassica cretica TaxID=69181 RepID=A0A8S9KKZ1_BRACR|nr:hypothetical protein F2Q68_00007879 [Brassica cretica]